MIVDVTKSPNADSRTADKGHVSFEDFSRATDMHREDVKEIIYELARRLREIADNHDYTKKTEEEDYYNSYIAAKRSGKDFHKSDWYKGHVQKERHHIKYHVADDINLLDILEVISDHCCDELTEKGRVGKMEIDPKVLMKAFNNTVDLVKGFIRLEDDYDDNYGEDD